MTSFPPLANNDVLLDRETSVAATRNRVKTFLKSISLYADAASNASPSRTYRVAPTDR